MSFYNLINATSGNEGWLNTHPNNETVAQNLNLDYSAFAILPINTGSVTITWNAPLTPFMYLPFTLEEIAVGTQIEIIISGITNAADLGAIRCLATSNAGTVGIVGSDGTTKSLFVLLTTTNGGISGDGHIMFYFVQGINNL